MDPQDQLISTRYQKKDKPYIALNKTQENARQDVINKIKNGKYQLSTRSCLLCGSNDFIILSNRDRYSLNVQTVICKNCSLMMTNPVMRDIDYADFYQNYYTKLYGGFQYSTDYFFELQMAAGKRLYDTIKKQIDLTDKIIAEVGCAAGGILFYLQAYCKSVVGCDYGSSFLKKGTSKGLNLKIGGIKSLKMEKPNVIIYSHVLEHVLDVNNELNEIYDILPKNGILIIDVPGIYNINKAYEADFLQYLQNAHLLHFTANTLKNMMASHRFKTIYVDERCIGIFKKTGTETINYKIDSCEYINVLKYLQRMEKLRLIIKIKLLPRKWFVKILKLIGIHRTIRHLYRKYFSN